MPVFDKFDQATHQKKGHLLKRKRLVYAGLALATIAIGLLSRQAFVPRFVYSYLGDVLYAVMVFFIMGFLFPSLSTFKTFLLCLIACYAIEVSQMYQAERWIEIRESQLGGLVLGRGFLWSDIISYTIGAIVAGFLELAFPEGWTKSASP